MRKYLILLTGLAIFPLIVNGASQGESGRDTSAQIVSFEWTGNQIPYPDAQTEEEREEIGTDPESWFDDGTIAIRGDTYPMTWADDGAIYASSGDPHWGLKGDGLDIEKFSGFPPDYTISKVNPMMGFRGRGGDGTKPSGLICVDGILYLAVQNIEGRKKAPRGKSSQHGSDAFIFRSNDHGLTWQPDIQSIEEPMFPGHLFGGPAFINFGKNNANARDDYVYAVSAEQWDRGDHLRLGRVPKGQIVNRRAWEWVSSFNSAKKPRWSSQLENAIPILTRERSISLPEMVYLAPIDRYILLTWTFAKDFNPDSGSAFFVYEAPEPWGPFSLIHEEPRWESQEVGPYCPRLPLKWVSYEEGNEITGWIQFSGSWRKNSPHYRSHVRPFRMNLKP